MGVYAHDSYKTILKLAVVDERAVGSHRKTFAAMAKHCRVHKPYLSKVLNKEGHLSADQLFLACDYLGFTQDETHYALLLHAHEVSQLESRRSGILKQIKKIREKKLRTEAYAKVKTADLSPEAVTRYYLDPMFTVIHMFLTVPRFSKKPETIAPVIEMKSERVLRYTSDLIKMGIVEKTATGLRVVRDHIHLPQDSDLLPAYRAFMRLKAIQRLDAAGTNQDYTFSVVFSSSPEVQRKIRERFLLLLKEMQGWVEKSESEQVYQMNFDLLSWT